jgi:Sec-independent protein translocase protein TatA
MSVVLGEIIGWEAVVVSGLIALLFGGAQLPKLVQSIGSARSQFNKGLAEGKADPRAALDKPAT